MCNMADKLFEVSEFQGEYYFLPDSGIDRTDSHLLDGPVVVLNLCFVLATKTFRDNDISTLTKDIVKLLLGGFQCSVVYLVYQNPKGNWQKLRDMLTR